MKISMKKDKIKLSPEARAARNKYIREWRRAHPEKVREYEAKRWERIAQAREEKRQGEKKNE